MKATQQLAAQFPAASTERDAISDQSADLFNYPTLFRRLCELQRERTVPQPLVQDVYANAQLAARTEELRRLNAMLRGVVEQQGLFAQRQAAFADALIARQNHQGFVDALRAIGGTPLLLQELGASVRKLAARQGDYQALGADLEGIRSAYQRQYDLILQQGEQLGLGQ